MVFVSEYLRGRAAQRFPDLQSKFLTVYNAVDSDFFSDYGEYARSYVSKRFLDGLSSHYFLYVGRLVEIKGVHILIDAFREVRAKISGVKLVICGSSFFEGAPVTAYQKSLKENASGLESEIIFTGYLDHADVRHLYSAATCVVVPSVWNEPQGMVALEAMASGTSLIASGVGGIAELIDDRIDGYVVPPGNSNVLADVMLSVLKNGDSKIPAQAREKVRNGYHWRGVANRIEAILGRQE